MKILILEPKNYSFEAQEILSTIGEISEGPYDREGLIGVVSQFDILVVRLGHKIDREIIDRATNLKYILTATTGLNHIDFNYCDIKGIKVISLKNEIAFLSEIYATSEHTWGLLLALIRNIPEAFESVKNNRWDRDNFKGFELNGKTLGIIGLGRIGKHIAHFGKSFGMKIVTYTLDSLEKHPNVQYLENLKAVFEMCDVISIHLPLESATKKIIGEQEFNAIKKPLVLINTSRGEIIDENALLKALKKGSVSAAALDVLFEENEFGDFTRSRLIDYSKSHSNLLITPHIGGATYESMKKTEIFIANKLVNILGEKNG